VGSWAVCHQPGIATLDRHLATHAIPGPVTVSAAGAAVTAAVRPGSVSLARHGMAKRGEGRSIRARVTLPGGRSLRPNR
jgi:hypothetical protein